jgi:hypothetical protein
MDNLARRFNPGRKNTESGLYNSDTSAGAVVQQNAIITEPTRPAQNPEQD